MITNNVWHTIRLGTSLLLASSILSKLTLLGFLAASVHVFVNLLIFKEN